MKNQLLLVSLTTTLLLGCSSPGSKLGTDADRADDERKSWYCEGNGDDSGEELTDEPAGTSKAWDCAQLTKQEIEQHKIKRQKQKAEKAAEPLPLAKDPAKAQPAGDHHTARTESTTASQFLATETKPPLYISLAYNPKEPTALLDLPETFWAIQIMALQDQTALNKFVTDNELIGISGAKIGSQGTLFYVLLLGVYESRSIAEEAWASRPQSIRSLKPYFRDLGSLQNAIRDGANL